MSFDRQLDMFLSWYSDVYPNQAQVLQSVPVVYDDRLLSEARQQLVRGVESVVVGPKFFVLTKPARAYVLTHELGHYVSSTIGLGVWSAAAQDAGVDVWHNLPWGAVNMEEAFADTYAVLVHDPQETRHQNWQDFVRWLVSSGPVGTKQKTADTHNTKDPWRNQYQNIRDALDHAVDFYDVDPIDEDLDPDDFVATRTYMSLDELYDYDDVGAWLETEPGELLELGPDELETWMYKKRGTHFAPELEEGLPAIVVLDTPQFTGVADGRGRVNYAVGIGIDTFPVILLTPKKKQ